MRLAAVLATARVPGAALAADGIVEINDARALAGGVTPGDAPGYPVTLDAPGSYALTGNLRQVDSSTAVVIVATSDVVLDLAGFEIRGDNECTSGCTLPAGSHGILSTFDRVVVRNGRVRGMAGRSIGRVLDSTASNNGGVGILAGSSSLISASSVRNNGDDGVRGGPGLVVRGCVIESNGGDGVDTSGALLKRNQISGHNPAGDYAIRGATGSVIELVGNVLANNNGGDANPQFITAGTFFQFGSNLCGSDLACP